MTRLALPLIATLLLSTLVAAQPSPSDHGGTRTMSDISGKEPPPSPATRAYMNAATAMHRDMAVAFKNDADRDFAATLEAQHKGAVAIAEVELQYGTDPQMRALAEEVRQSRQKELAMIAAWRKAHP